MAIAKRSKDELAKVVKSKSCPFQFYKIGKNGLIEFGGDLVNPQLEAPPEGYTAVPPPDGLYHPKWDGEDWIEGGSPPPVEPNATPPVTIQTLQKEIEELKAQIANLISTNNLKAPPIKVLPTKEVKG